MSNKKIMLLSLQKTEEQKECINVNENNQKLNKKEETQKFEINEKRKQVDTSLPQMEHTVLNLDHTKIMNRVSFVLAMYVCDLYYILSNKY